MRLLRIFVTVFAILVGLFFLARWLVGNASPVPDNLGITDGRLAPCPSTPNCVSTRDTDAEHGMAPIPYDTPTGVAYDQLLAIITADPQATLITTEPDYIYAEYRSPIWQFVDDVEFQLEAGRGEIHFRSASRLGQGDLGANRDRMQAITDAFTAASE